MIVTYAQEARAPLAPLAMAPELLAEDITPHIVGLRDREGGFSVLEARERALAGAFAPISSRTPDFGFTSDTIWLYLPLENPTDVEEWRLRLRENFFQEFAVWHVPDGGTVMQIEFQDETTGFPTRNIQWPELVVGFEQAPGSTGALLIRYRSGGSTEVGFTLFDVEVFEAWADRKTAKNFIYYGMLLFLTILAFATWVTTRQGIFLAYASYAIFALLFIMHADGNTFRYLWPDAPAFNAFATIPLGTAIVVLGANFARQFLQTSEYHPVFDRILLLTIAVTFLVALSSAFVDTQLIKKLLVLMAFFSTLLFLASGVNAARTRWREVRFFVIAWSGAVISSAIMTGRLWLGLEISEELQFDSMRIVFVLDAALMGLAILDRFNNLRKGRAEALETSLATAERNLALSQRLQALEQKYAWASDLAVNREQRMADAIHDLRQPLHALRLNVQALLSNGEAPASGQADVGKNINETFRFLETLVNEELNAHAAAPPSAPSGTEPVDLGEVLNAVGKMFAPDAEAKGVALTVARSNARLRLPAVAIMRILTNLVSNAVRYTEQGRVHVGLTAIAPSALRIEVDDTGPGLTLEEFEAALKRSARLEKTSDQEGHGLGLEIVVKTCRIHGLTFERLEKSGPGSRFGVTLGAEHLDARTA